ncbi:MAG TPA: prepilin-type N-terminal cleavage/methylation domain-containing protein [Luteolibacter sp.]
MAYLRALTRNMGNFAHFAATDLGYLPIIRQFIRSTQNLSFSNPPTLVCSMHNPAMHRLSHPSPKPFQRRFARQGFTLVEILVVIAIVMILVAAMFLGIRNVRERAQAAVHLSDIRQSGTILLGIASENNGVCTYALGGAGTAYDKYHYIMMWTALGLTKTNAKEPVVEIMHWNSKKLPPALPHWNCRAVNFETATYPDGTQTKWVPGSLLDSSGNSTSLMSLSLASVARPGSYPLLIDSSSSSGLEIFRVHESNGGFVGLREAGGTKANAFMFDGSARSMDKADLKKAGCFKKVYDNSTKPPKQITL